MCYLRESRTLSNLLVKELFLKGVFTFRWIVGTLLMFMIGCASGPTHESEVSSFVTEVSEADSVFLDGQFEAAIRNPEKADSILSGAEELLEEKPELQGIYNAGYGRFLILTGKLDKAREHVQSAIDEYGDDSLHYNLAKYHNLIAAIEAYSKAHEESVHHFKRAIRIYEMNGDDHQASIIKCNLANVFFGRLDYESAYRYSQEALESLEAVKDTTHLILCLSVLSVAETNLYKKEEAEEHARCAVHLAEKHPDLQGKLLSNYAMAEVELLKDDYEASIRRFEETIELGETYQMYQWLLPVRAALLKAYLSVGNNKEAVAIGESLVEQAEAFGNRDILYSALKNLALAQENLGQYAQAFENMKEAEELFRENMSETTERILRETLVEYETEKKNNIILQQESNLSRQQTWNVVLIGSVLLILLILIWIWKNVQQKNKLLIREKENAVYLAINEGEERERKRLAGELHDGIASNLVAIKLKIENSDLPVMMLDDLLPLVSKTHAEIRQTAHNLAPLNFEQHSLTLALQTFASESSNQNCTVTFQSNENGRNAQFPKSMALIIYRAVQELTQNALKHAEASSIDIQLMYNEPMLQVSVEDNGKGFDPSLIGSRPSGGLNNLINRLSNMGASIDIDSRPDHGTAAFIHIQYPEL